MKVIGWTCWLLAMCICFSEARNKLRRPPLAPLPHAPPIFKKSWPIGPRISMGNTIHIGGNFPHKRISYKPPNYRIRRPPTFNILPTTWKTQMPVLGILNNHAVLPQRPPVKEFHTMNQVPEYSPEYRPEPMILPPTHRGNLDDDKGPIHTIPAPNLSPADKPYNSDANSGQKAISQHQYSNDLNYNLNLQGNTLANDFGLATIGTSLAPQRTVTSPTPIQHQYEVTEDNDLAQKEYHTVQPTFFTPEFDVTRLATVVNPDLQTNEVFLNHPPITNTGLANIQFGQTDTPMQTNLRSSLHVGFPGTATQAANTIGNQIPDLHVGHPAPAGPPLSATQLYELLNSFPNKLTEQYTAVQQPQLQQHLLQQQLGQLLQPNGVTSFSQPQMHSFNYDEQDNQQQQQQQQQHQQLQHEQQQILLDPNFASGRVTADYNLEAEPSNIQQTDIQSDEELSYTAEVPIEQTENNIDYEETNNRAGQSTYFSKVTNNGGLSTQFYTSLPNREAAEKLAALAAAGNVNSQLIGHLRKQQLERQQQSEVMPPNHKDESYQDTQEQQEQQQQQQQQQQQYESQYEQQQQYHQQRIHHEQAENEKRDKQRFLQQQQQQHRRRLNQQNLNQEKRPLRIMVPDDEEYVNDSDSQNEEKIEYEYEIDEGDTKDSRTTTSSNERLYEQNSKYEFGTRLRSKTGK